MTRCPFRCYTNFALAGSRYEIATVDPAFAKTLAGCTEIGGAVYQGPRAK